MYHDRAAHIIRWRKPKDEALGSEQMYWMPFHHFLFLVCVKYLTKFIDSLDSDTKSDAEKVDAAFRKVCKTSVKDDNRFVSIKIHTLLYNDEE